MDTTYTPFKEIEIPEYASDNLAAAIKDFNQSLHELNEAIEALQSRPEPAPRPQRSAFVMAFQAWITWTLIVAGICGAIALIAR